MEDDEVRVSLVGQRFLGFPDDLLQEGAVRKYLQLHHPKIWAEVVAYRYRLYLHFLYILLMSCFISGLSILIPWTPSALETCSISRELTIIPK